MFAATPRTVAPGPGSFQIGDFTIWGTDGDTVTAADFAYDEAAKTLTVNTDKRFALQTGDQTIAEADDSPAGAIAGTHVNPVDVGIVIPAGRDAHITLAGVGIRTPSTPDNRSALDIAPGATCHLVLADGTFNSLIGTASNGAGIHNPTGASLIIDDSVPNRDIAGNPVIPEGGCIPGDMTLANGKNIHEGDPLTVMDSSNPGSLYAMCTLGVAAGIGGLGDISLTVSGSAEACGSFTMEGGIVTARSSQNWNYGGWYCSAGLGGGAWGGNGTSLTDWITINGGRLTAIGSFHGAGIGSGNQGASGNIRINGGYVISKGGDHGSGFGAACIPADSSAFKIVLTGGTLIPSTVTPPASGCGDIGAPNANTTITGGSIGNGREPGDFSFAGSAHNAAGEPIEMIQVDLTSDVGENAYAITNWQLLVDGEPYDYGAPAEFDKGHLYLWLPEEVKKNSEVTVKFTYLNTDKLDENGNPTPVTPMDLFRPGDNDLPAGAPNDGKLRRYVDFELDKDYLAGLNKYYDGKPFPSLPLPFEAPDGRNLTDGDAITYRYQKLDASGNPIGPELESHDPSGASQMPSDVGTMKFTAVSTQYSDDTEGKFSESYWGHRATGQCVIKPIPSQVRDLRAEWDDEADAAQKPGDVAHPSDQVLRVSAVIDRGPTVDGAPLAADESNATAPTCKAPQGRIQIYVDGEPVGGPVDLLFEDRKDETGAVVEPRNAWVEDNGEGGTVTRFSLARAAATSDFLVPSQGKEGRHEIALRFLPPSEAQQKAGSPANYLASQDPTEDPSVPRAEVTIEPIDPNPKVELPATPGLDPTDAPALETDYDHPTSDDPADKYSDKTYKGTLDLVYQETAADGTNPGRIELKLDTPSSGAITVTTADGTVIKAEVVTDDEGNPVRDENGKITVRVDPESVGKTELTIRQEPNGAYTGTTFDYAVTVRPQPKIAPAPALAKKAENLTHPNGPTQPGDRVRYTVTASNTAAGSLWTQVVLSDPLPTCLELAGASVELTGADGKARKLVAAAPGAAPAAGQYALSAPGADGRRTLTVPAGDIGGGRSAVLTFECAVAGGLDFSDAGAVDLANIASAEGKRPNPDDPDGPDVGPVAPPDTPPATPPGGGTVAPADPEIKVAKAVENLTAPGAEVTRVGDTLRYTVELRNDGPADSCLMEAIISDPLPAGLEPVAGTLAVTLPDGTERAVGDDAYDEGARTIAVTAGDLWGGQRVTLTFDVTVGEAALGAGNANIAAVHGTVPSEGPGAPADPEPGQPAAPPTGDPEALTPPAVPPTLVGEDPDEGDIAIGKTAENISRGDGTTRVGDTVRYEIALSNEGAGTSWMDAVIRDDVPEGLEPVAGTLRLTLPDGREVAVDDAAYDPKTRVLAVAAGHLHGGQRAVLSFDALVTEAAVGADVGNVAVGYGTPPSAWDPDGVHPEPGAPFDPPGGWGAWERGRDKVVSDPAYPPGVDGLGGVLPGDESDKRRTTIAHKLAQTGDALAAAAGLPLAAALAAGALVLASRRRRERAR